MLEIKSNFVEFRKILKKRFTNHCETYSMLFFRSKAKKGGHRGSQDAVSPHHGPSKSHSISKELEVRKGPEHHIKSSQILPDGNPLKSATQKPASSMPKQLSALVSFLNLPFFVPDSYPMYTYIDEQIDYIINLKNLDPKGKKKIRTPSGKVSLEKQVQPPTMTQKIFILFDDGMACQLGCLIFMILMGAIIISVISFVSSTIPTLKHSPKSCDMPVYLNNDRTSTMTFCEPVPIQIFSTLETMCVSIFTIDYVIRMFTAITMSPRYAFSCLASRHNS